MISFKIFKPGNTQNDGWKPSNLGDVETYVFLRRWNG